VPQRDKVFFVGTLMALVGLVAIVFMDVVGLHGVPRIAVVSFFFVGMVLHTGTFFVSTWDRNGFIRSATGSPTGMFWLRILAIFLWLGILPLIFLWLYHYLHRLGS
jgi:hypothetical protein